jgi:hypothetical protein
LEALSLCFLIAQVEKSVRLPNNNLAGSLATISDMISKEAFGYFGVHSEKVLTFSECRVK